MSIYHVLFVIQYNIHKNIDELMGLKNTRSIEENMKIISIFQNTS